MSGYVRVLSSDQRLADAVQAAFDRAASEPGAEAGATQAALIVFAPLLPDEGDSEGEIAAAAALWRLIECEKETRGAKRAFLNCAADPARTARVAGALESIGARDGSAARAIAEALVTFDEVRPKGTRVPLWIERAWRTLGRLCDAPADEAAAEALAATFGGSRTAPAVLKRMLMTAQAALAAASRRRGGADGALYRELEQTQIELGDARRRLFEAENAQEAQRALAGQSRNDADRLIEAEEQISRLLKSQEDQRRFIAMIGQRITASEAEAERLGAELAARNAELGRLAASGGGAGSGEALQQAQARIADLERAAQARAAAIDQIEDQLRERAGVLEQAQARIAELEQEAEARFAVIKQFEDRLDDRTVGLGRAQTRIAELEHESETRATAIRQIEDLLHDRSIVLQQAQSRVAVLEQDLEAKAETLAQFDNALGERSATLQAVLGDLAAREEELRLARGDAERKEQARHALTLRLSGLDRDLADLQARLAERDGALATAERRLRVADSLRRDVSAALGQARMAAEDQAAQAAALRAALEDAAARAWPPSALARWLSRLAALLRSGFGLRGRPGHPPPARG